MPFVPCRWKSWCELGRRCKAAWRTMVAWLQPANDVFRYKWKTRKKWGTLRKTHRIIRNTNGKLGKPMEKPGMRWKKIGKPMKKQRKTRRTPGKRKENKEKIRTMKENQWQNRTKKYSRKNYFNKPPLRWAMAAMAAARGRDETFDALRRSFGPVFGWKTTRKRSLRALGAKCRLPNAASSFELSNFCNFNRVHQSLHLQGKARRSQGAFFLVGIFCWSKGLFKSDWCHVFGWICLCRVEWCPSVSTSG